MPRFFNKALQPGMPVSTHGFAEGVMALAKAFETMEVANGYVDWSFGEPTIITNGADAGISAVPDGTVERDILVWDYSASEWTTEAMPLPDGDVEKGIIEWDNTNKKYIKAAALVKVPAGTASGQALIWNGTAWIATALTQLSFITSRQYDTTSHKWQYKTTTGYVYDAGTESAWTDEVQAVEGVSV